MEEKVSPTVFSFLCHKKYSDAMNCSFSGTYFDNEEFIRVKNFLDYL